MNVNWTGVNWTTEEQQERIIGEVYGNIRIEYPEITREMVAERLRLHNNKIICPDCNGGGDNHISEVKNCADISGHYASKEYCGNCASCTQLCPTCKGQGKVAI